MAKVFTFDAKVVRVIDGDTYEVSCDQGFGNSKVIHLRIYDHDTPEVRGEEKEQGEIVKAYVEDLFRKHDNQIKVVTRFQQSFARWLGDALIGEMNVGEHLESIGYTK